jgi:flavin-dependent dehydrogenase
MKRVETLVVGGGPAGAATACGLAVLGREVVLVERSAAPHHKVCGEFLSVETQVRLRRLGVDAVALGAVSIDRVAVFSANRQVAAALPFLAQSLSRYRLDDALLRRAETQGAEVKRNVAVRGVTPVGRGWSVACDDGEVIECRNLVLATGKVGLRGIDDERDTSLVGLKIHLGLAPQAGDMLAGRVELSLFDGGYAGLELVENGVANLCLVLPRDVVARVGTGWPELRVYLSAAQAGLAERLTDAVPLFDRALAVACPTGGYLQSDAATAVFRVGDRIAHIPPFTGDGIAIALTSAALAAEHIRLGQAPAAYLAAARRLVEPSIRFASLISKLGRNRWGSAFLMSAAARAPGLLAMIACRTRLPLPSQ